MVVLLFPIRPQVLAPHASMAMWPSGSPLVPPQAMATTTEVRRMRTRHHESFRDRPRPASRRAAVNRESLQAGVKNT